MNILADNMGPYLRTNGIRLVRSMIGTTLDQAIHESDTGYYNLHLTLHFNAVPPQLSGQLRGTDIYYYPYSTVKSRAAEIIARDYEKIYPLPDRVRTMLTTVPAKIIKTDTPAVLIEAAYHDNPEDVEWPVTHMPEIAANLVRSLTGIFGIPFIDDPQPACTTKVVTQGGNLSIRDKPSLDATVIGQAPNGAIITVLGE